MGFWRVSLRLPSALFDFLGEKKMTGSMFSASSSNTVAFRFIGDERAAEVVRFMMNEELWGNWVGKAYHSDDS